MIQLLQRTKNKKGFTLIELIVVIAIISILILIAVPAYNAYVTSSTKRANDATAATIAKAAAIYVADPDVEPGDAVDSPPNAEIQALVDKADIEWDDAEIRLDGGDIQAKYGDGDTVGYFPANVTGW